MSNTTPHAPTLNGVPHLGRAEAVLYLFLYYVFGVIHPRYARYIEALTQHERLGVICQRADALQAYIGAFPAPARALPWRGTDLPDIYFALLYAWRLVRPRPWANLATPALSRQVFPAIQPD